MEEGQKSNISRKSMYETFTSKSTYVSSGKFEYSAKEIIFSVLYSFALSLIFALVSLVFFLHKNSDAALNEVGVFFFLVLGISMIIIFTLRIVAKRGVEIFSIIILMIFFLTFIFLKTLPDGTKTFQVLDTATSNASVSKISKVVIGGREVSVRLAETKEERIRGLSGSNRLPKNTGMLFILDAPGTYGFWMKDMRYPIDIIWINEAFSVVSFAENASPEDYPRVYSPESDALYVLEVPAGFVKDASIVKREKVDFIY
jgi:uncharacterized membrane protein (UPF0127 family)